MTIDTPVALDTRKQNGAFDPTGWFLVELKDIKNREPVGGFWIRRRTVFRWEQRVGRA
jgi:hypothetical protein